ncbi:hypothetical protein OAP36_02105 [Planktomarina temperata]|nr:hypothetical protein [Planktomarina temperata]
MKPSVVYLPMRKGSERVKNKNTRPFVDKTFGLFELKINQLSKVMVDRIIISTNDEEIIAYCEKLNDSRIIVDHRPEEYCTSTTSTDDLIRYASSLFDNETVLWTHVTSPFIDEKIYNTALKFYRKMEPEFDSLMTVNRLQSFLWNNTGPINYDKNTLKWPWTQSLDTIYEVNSGIFIADSLIYRNDGDRIGNKPYLFETDDIISFDIDWESDFYIAEQIYKSRNNIA